MVSHSFWQGKRVLLTGHTGFKGAWLSLWLLHLGAKVTGLSLEPDTQPALFSQLNLATELDHHIGDIRDATLVKAIVERTKPDVVFHLAAQPLVRRSYLQPVETWNTNVMGTIHVLEALKQCTHPCAAVFITTDKCYENREWNYGYRENDPLGGHDPYSSSKAAAELAIASWRKSFFKAPSRFLAIASARAGNVIGGGDWAEDRIVPDAMRALSCNQPILVRNPLATRPWQHVLEPLGGYLLLAECLYGHLVGSTTDSQLDYLESAFNFGPELSSNQPVKNLVESILTHWPGQWIDVSREDVVHEAKLLNLVTDKAFHYLNWRSAWNFPQTIQKTVDWYRRSTQFSSEEHEKFRCLTLDQIKQYEVALNQHDSVLLEV